VGASLDVSAVASAVGLDAIVGVVLAFGHLGSSVVSGQGDDPMSVAGDKREANPRTEGGVPPTIWHVRPGYLPPQSPVAVPAKSTRCHSPQPSSRVPPRHYPLVRLSALRALRGEPLRPFPTGVAGASRPLLRPTPPSAVNPWYRGIPREEAPGVLCRPGGRSGVLSRNRLLDRCADASGLRPSHRRIGAAAGTQPQAGPLARPIPRLKPPVGRGEPARRPAGGLAAAPVDVTPGVLEVAN
jgi:hypothetical protein